MRDRQNRGDHRDGKTSRCAIYTRKSTEEGLEQEFNSLDAQREACAAYILSQRHEGWDGVETIYDDGGYSGGTMDRPALKLLLADVAAGNIDIIVVYKVDRLTRSLADFAKIVEILDARGASFVSVTQSFNTTTSMGRLTLNVLLSFAQFEREVTSERIRDKIAQSKAKGMWMGGPTPLGYVVVDRKLVIDETEAATVHFIFARYLELGSGTALTAELEDRKIISKRRISRNGRPYGGCRLSRGAVYTILKNRLYVGEVSHKGKVYPGQHDAIVDRETFEATQQLMDQGRVEQKLGRGTGDPSLIAGLLWDEHGRRMSPTHCSKRSRRYRYYMTQTYRAPPTDQPVWRVSAPDIEQRVIGVLGRQLDRANREAIAKGDLSVSDIGRLQSIVDAAVARLQGSGREQRGGVIALVKRIELGQTHLTLESTFGALDPLLGEYQSDTIAISCVRVDRHLRLVIPPEQSQTNANRNLPLIKLVAQAMTARDVMANSSAAEFDDLAAKIGYSREHAAGLLRIAYLAPDIIAAILDGRQPVDLNRTRLMRWPALPFDWQQQRIALGFA